MKPFLGGAFAVSSFFVSEGCDRGRRFELPVTGVATIGREEGNQIQLRDTEVSRRHAQVVYENNRFVLTDLNSSNGTFVNGKRIDQKALNSGDQILMGSTRLQFNQTSRPNVEESFNSWVSFELPTSDRSQIVSSVRHADNGKIFSEGGGHSFMATQGVDSALAQNYLELVSATATALKSTVDINTLLEKIIELIFQWVKPDRGCIMLWDEASQQLQPSCFRIREDNAPDKEVGISVRAPGSSDKISISKTILDYVMTHKEGVLTSNAMADSRFDAAVSIIQSQVNEAICVPLEGRYGNVGVIYIDTSQQNDPQALAEKVDALDASKSSQNNKPRLFHENHLEMMVAIAYYAAIAIEDSRFYGAMIQSERLAAIGQTVANLSHHIKNILQGISGGSYLIEAGLNSHDEQLVGKGWKIVERNQGKISALVMDMLSFSKERAAEPILDDMNEAIDEVVELMAGRATEQSVQLVWNRCPDLSPFYFDRNLIHRAILNLVTNAIDASAEAVAEIIAENPDDQPLPDPPPQGRVEVVLSLDESGRHVQIAVLDNGQGVPEDKLEQIFLPFFSSKGAKGTGLGLPVVKKVVSEHGGTVVAQRRPEGGTRFVVTLPFKTAPEGNLATQL